MEVIDARDRVVVEARGWLGTPFRHNQHVKGKKGGIDCANLVAHAGRDAGVFPFRDEDFERYEPYYGRYPNAPIMRRAFLDLGLLSIPGRIALPGDIAWMHWDDGYPVHMAILAWNFDRDTLVHSVWDIGVIEFTFDDISRSRVVEYFRYPGISECES